MDYKLSSPVWSSSTTIGLWILGLECRAPLVVPAHVEPASHRPLQAVELGIQSGVPGDLPLPAQPVFHPECQPLSEAVGRHAGETCE